MENLDMTLTFLIGFAALIGIIILLVFIKRSFVNVGAREIAIKERRYSGRRMPPGRVVATEGEVGIQADVLKPGLHWIKFPFEKVVRKVPLIEIGPDELGIIERRYSGRRMPPGRVVATEGEVGIQADVLKPGLHWIKFPFEKVVRKVP